MASTSPLAALRRAAVSATLLLAACSSSTPSTTAGATNATSTRPGAATTTTRTGEDPTTTTTTTSPATTTAPCTTASAVSAMSLEARAAQVIVVPSLDFNVESLQATLDRGVGGVLFLGRATAPADLADRIARARPAGGIAPWTMADQEGGGVQRMKGAVDDIAWPRTMGATMTPSEIRAVAARAGHQLRAAGIDVDLAPVLDVDGRPGPNDANPAGRRSFGDTPAAVERSALAFADGLRDAGIVPVVKHFPGLGGSTAHTDVAAGATRPIEELRASDLQPFRAAIAAGIPAVMVSNASVPGLSDRPAVVDPAVVRDLLRGELGFTGLIVTDSLSAEAIEADGLSLSDAVVASLAAGNDLVLFGSTLDAKQLALLAPAQVDATTARIIDAIVVAVRAGSLPESRLDEAVLHVVEAKGAGLC